MPSFLKRPFEQYLFVAALVIALLALLVFRAPNAKTWSEQLDSAAAAKTGGLNAAETEAVLQRAQEQLALTSESAGNQRKAFNAALLALAEPDRLQQQRISAADRRAQSLQPLDSIPLPNYYGSPDFLPVAGLAPSIHLQKRSIRHEEGAISLEPGEDPSHFGRNRIGGN